ncbi:hypothetical protein Tco_1409015 [Tanacetum coccineum]
MSSFFNTVKGNGDLAVKNSSFDMWTPTPAKCFACLGAKVTSDEILKCGTEGTAWICDVRKVLIRSLFWFAEIVDFLRGSNLKYALTTNLTIHDSLVKQFWQTATAKTLADGTLELHATIDTIAYTITEASIRSKLKLADASGITMLLNNEIFEGMGHMGYPTHGSFTFWRKAFSHPNDDS